jgi:uncharacterized membrane protein ArfC
MAHVNYWLAGVSFLLGLLLTSALTIRRVKREVPVRSSAGTAPVAAAAVAAPVKSPSEAETTKIKANPYGAGSARPGTDGSGPEGWLVKGNEDSMLYHTPDSPHYKETIAEVWFKDEESAEQGGFTPWHRGKKKD